MARTLEELATRLSKVPPNTDEHKSSPNGCRTHPWVVAFGPSLRLDDGPWSNSLGALTGAYHVTAYTPTTALLCRRACGI
jgi:hypothetical protein